MLEGTDDYFAKETEVFNEFLRQIDKASIDGYNNIFADATHLNKSSRNKVLYNLKEKYEEINLIYLDTPLNICLERNKTREGRKFVPEDTIKSMYKSLRLPDETESINKIYIVKDNEPINIIELK